MSAPAQLPAEQSEDGRFVSQDDAFRGWLRADGSGEYHVEAGRYHLYGSLACPWAHRTIIARTLKGLESTIGMTVVDPLRDDEHGWAFRDVRGETRDPINGFRYLREAYDANDPHYRGRITVPVLWDTQSECILSYSDDDIMRMFETELDAVAARPELDLYPARLRAEIDALNERIYDAVNDGVYRAGFATEQKAYERAAREVFAMLDELDVRLGQHRYLFGDAPAETDWRLFVTLVRFDAVYYGHFKCNLRRIADYANLLRYLRDLYQIDGVAQTVDFDHIKRHYYMTHEQINPTRIVPIGPAQDLSSPHGRETLVRR